MGMHMARRQNPESGMKTLLMAGGVAIAAYFAYQWLQSNCASGSPMLPSLCSLLGMPAAAPVESVGSPVGCLSNLTGAIMTAAGGNANLAAEATAAMTLGDQQTLDNYCAANPAAIPAVPASVLAYIQAHPVATSPVAAV